jgi:hypothetical protein
MSRQDVLNAQQVRRGLALYEQEVRHLAGISDAAHRETLVKQFVESLRRIRYVTLMTQRDVSSSRADPASDQFDPERAAVLHHRQGRLDEAFWLVFLSVHFGKPRRSGWRLVRDIYGRLGDGGLWNWALTSTNPAAFRQWLATNLVTLKGGDGVLRKFGNHRKYESLHPFNANGTGAVIESYVNWVNHFGSHDALIHEAATQTDGSARPMFDYLYQSMDAVIRFGRTAKFDYLTMVGKLGLAPIEPGSAYMDGATGPFKGAKLLFGNAVTQNLRRSDLDDLLIELEAYLNVGMQPMEDALCNWQKSPDTFVAFRG